MITHLRGWAVAWLILLATSTLAAARTSRRGLRRRSRGRPWPSGPDSPRPIEAKDPIFSGDTLATKAESSLQAIFSDGTTVALGPESLFFVDEYVNEWGQEHTLSTRCVSPTDRACSGPSPGSSPTAIRPHFRADPAWGHRIRARSSVPW
jgi:hypothetical protein